jgi:3-dehydroquinate synthetase
VQWVNLPTSLLSMVDAGLGGKTGAICPRART